MKKIIITFCAVIALITIFNNVTMAKEVQIGNSEQVYQSGVTFTKVNVNMKPQMEPKVSNMAGVIFGVAAYICYGAAFIIIAIKGVQFMNAAPEGKAEIKKQMIAVAVGAFIIFSIRSILTIISNTNLFG